MIEDIVLDTMLMRGSYHDQTLARLYRLVDTEHQGVLESAFEEQFSACRRKAIPQVDLTNRKEDAFNEIRNRVMSGYDWFSEGFQVGCDAKADQVMRDEYVDQITAETSI